MLCFVCVFEGSSVKKKRRAKVTYSYTPVNDDELQLKVGDVVDITGMVSGDHFFITNAVHMQV